jgi:hypothetical protein
MHENPGFVAVTMQSEPRPINVNEEKTTMSATNNNERNSTVSKARSFALRVQAVFMGLIGLFFVFYTARLVYVTQGLTAVRAGGNGTYIGAVTFPILAIVFGYGAWRLVKSTRRSNHSAD